MDTANGSRITAFIGYGAYSGLIKLLINSFDRSTAQKQTHPQNLPHLIHKRTFDSD